MTGPDPFPAAVAGPARDHRVKVYDGTGRLVCEWRCTAYSVLDSGAVALRQAYIWPTNPHERAPKALLWPWPGGHVEVFPT